jgi:helix-turn-helix protein
MFFALMIVPTIAGIVAAVEKPLRQERVKRSLSKFERELVESSGPTGSVELSQSEHQALMAACSRGDTASMEAILDMAQRRSEILNELKR